jgi:hypothetical protein
MKKTFFALALLSLVFTGCTIGQPYGYGGAYRTYGPGPGPAYGGPAQGPRPTFQPLAAGMSGGGNARLTWVKAPRSAYECIIDVDNPHVIRGTVVQLQNIFCNGTRDISGDCADANFSTYQALKNQHVPIVVKTADNMAVQHQGTGETLLPPGMSCYMLVKARTTVRLRMKAYMDVGPANGMAMFNPDEDDKAELDFKIEKLTNEPILIELGEGRYW